MNEPVLRELTRITARFSATLFAAALFAFAARRRVSAPVAVRLFAAFLAAVLVVAVCANAVAQTPAPSPPGAAQGSSRGHMSHRHIKTLVLSVGLIAVFTLFTPRSK